MSRRPLLSSAATRRPARDAFGRFVSSGRRTAGRRRIGATGAKPASRNGGRRGGNRVGEAIGDAYFNGGEVPLGLNDPKYQVVYGATGQGQVDWMPFGALCGVDKTTPIKPEERDKYLGHTCSCGRSSGGTGLPDSGWLVTPPPNYTGSKTESICKYSSARDVSGIPIWARGSGWGESGEAKLKEKLQIWRDEYYK